MKKLLSLFAATLMLASCGQDDKKNPQEQEGKKTPDIQMIIPQKIPVNNGNLTFENNNGGGNGTVLQMEEGKPLDFSQLQAGNVSVGDRVAAQIDSIRNMAEQGDAKFQYAYGVCYEKGWGVEQDLKEAVAWYNKAAEQNNGPALNSLGNCYRIGNGVKADPKKAVEWYQKGATEKDSQAMLNLGNCYYYGMGVMKDENAAVKWWKASAEAGNAYAMAQMGDCYYFGLGVEKDLSKAIEYYTPAIDKNISSALYRLGTLYYTGDGVDKDQAYAELLMRKARDAGMKEAQDFLDKYFKK